jgi:hypothetical protein
MTLKTTSRVKIALSATALIAAMAAAGAARAADDGSGDLFDVAKSILLYGSTNDEKPAIDYRERAPLVLPKDRAALPAPAQRTRRADWPNDPDVAARAAAAKEANAPRSALKNQTVRMSPHEMANDRGGGETGLAPEDGCRNNGGGSGGCLWMSPDKLRSLGVKKDEVSRIPVGSEPDRQWLTQPPKGYRRVTQDAGAGTAAPKQFDDGPNIRGFLTNPFGKKDDDE